jgi:biotin carboxyl carrier protein
MSRRALAVLQGLVLLAGALVVGGWDERAAPVADPAAVADAASAEVPAVPAPVPAPPSPSAAAAPPAPSPEPTPETPPPVERSTTTTGFAPYATAGPVVLHAPGDVVEVIGFHQSSHDGAQPLQPLEGAPVRAGLLETRGRDTHPQGATDVVVDPAREVRSPVTGRVLRAGGYTLYCDRRDEFLVVEPDARPGWEVKVLHVEGLRVRAGDRVEAGSTVVADRARPLPFRSQVDDATAEPSWPHVHVEVVDPGVPDRPSGRSC